MNTGQRILIVDDDESFRARLMKAITARGYETVGAGSVAEAIEVAREARPAAAVVDLRMPGGKSGLDLVPELVARHPGIQVVILTGYGSITTAVEAVRKGAINYLMKPVDADQILAAFETEHEAMAAENMDMPSLARVEWEHIQRVLADCDGNISLASKKLGIHRRSLQRKLAKLPPLE